VLNESFRSPEVLNDSFKTSRGRSSRPADPDPDFAGFLSPDAVNDSFLSPDVVNDSFLSSSVPGGRHR
ncbi:hypothetical protein, partial [Amycolatopsis solani]|uniref:hypothetical protein n=1 Tax=Amycolatopsis solani TaxID=3028615 RepID=UPI0025B1F0D1